MIFAMVKVLPEPVTPRRVWNLFFSFIPLTSCLIAFGCEPFGLNGDFSSNFGIIWSKKGEFLIVVEKGLRIEGGVCGSEEINNIFMNGS